MMSCHASQGGENSEIASVEREAIQDLLKPSSVSLSFQLFKGYARLKDYELAFLLKKGNIGELMK